jgi:transcriptional regulator GlxA family with amidase domain
MRRLVVEHTVRQPHVERVRTASRIEHRVGADAVATQRPGKHSPAHRETTVQLMAELYIRAQVAVERGYRRRLTLGMLAHALAASPRQLERAYDEIGLTTFAAHLRAVRLRNAAELLAHQPLTVTDVSWLVGYRQPSHFVKAFRRRFGMTPGAFRDAARHGAAMTAADVRGGLPRPGAERSTRAAIGRNDQ